MEVLEEFCIISGGQTGADRAALDFAIHHGIHHGGWCPSGRLAEDGPLSFIYKLKETTSRRYPQRTKWNVRDSDATVIFTFSAVPSSGTALTLRAADRFGKPSLHLRRQESASVFEDGQRLSAFIEEFNVKRLNIAGPRASQEPDIGEYVDAVLAAALIS